MIKGIGIDMVYIPEMKRLIENNGFSFINHTFSSNEINNVHNTKDKYYSELFAVKEATFKAISSFTSEKLDLRKIETINIVNESPYIHITPKLQLIIKKIILHNFMFLFPVKIIMQ